MVLDFLLRYWARTGATNALTMARETFVHMTRGGIYDQIGGGFARYAVDTSWLVPHFEKMLYDNALLMRFGAHLYQATNDGEVRRITEATVAWLAREMTSPTGGWYSSLDADSEGQEGKFYLWDASELDALLGGDAEIVKAYYGVTDGGNFEGKNILYIPTDPQVIATRAGVSTETLMDVIQRAQRVLYEARVTRVWPGRDTKVLAAWNGLTLLGVADAARIFNRDDFAQLALRNAEFLLAEMVRDGRVMRTHKNGVTHIPGFLEDHAAVALGFLAIFEQTLDVRWIVTARVIADHILESFWDAPTGLLYDTAHDAEPLMTRPRDVTDNAIPSGTSLTVDLLFRLANYLDIVAYQDPAQRVLDSLGAGMTKYPMAFGHLLSAAEYAITFACHGAYCDMPSPDALAPRAARHT